MIDLAKPLGIQEGVVFYGDHEHEDLVYYFPDEVSLAPQLTGNGDESGFYDLFFQIFNEGDIIEGGIDDLRKTAGSILSVGVQCTVSKARLEKAVQLLKGNNVLPDQLRVSTPLWKDGSVNLFALDAISTEDKPMGEDTFVKSILGTHKPSLMSSDLKSIFNVRFDRRGTALIASALNGGTGNVAGILYDLKFPAIRPAVDLRIWANLGRCYDSISHQLGIKAEFTYYVKFSLGAELEWVTKKLEEDGDLKIEVLSQAEDAETKKMIDEMVKDFKESILKEIFRPYVNPQMTNITNMESMVPVVGVAYKFKKEKISHEKVIEVDYRERSTIVRTHTPQSHLWVLGKQIAANRDKYIQKVIFSDVWREQSLSIQLIHDFEDEENDLLSTEVMIWRKRDGMLEEVEEGRFAIPDNVDPLKHITLHKEQKEKVNIAWLYDKDEAIGYYYQIRFTYSDKIENISSPSEIVTETFFSSNQDLIIFPDTYTFYKRIEIREGNISFDDYKGIDVTLHLKNADGELLDAEVVTINEENKNDIWTVRGKDKNDLFVEMSQEFHYSDERPSIHTEPLYLMDDEIIINKPFLKSSFTLIPVIAGKVDNIEEILLEVIINSPSLENPIKELYRISGPDFNTDEIEIKLHSDKDEMFYKANAISKDGKIIEINSGEISDNVLVLDLKKTTQNEVVFIWDGPDPEALDLKYLRVELRAITQDGSQEKIKRIEYTGDEFPRPISKVFPIDWKVEMRIVKRFFDGQKEKNDFELITTNEVIIKPE